MKTTYEDLYAAALGLSNEMRLTLIENFIPTIRSEAAVEAEQASEIDH